MNATGPSSLTIYPCVKCQICYINYKHLLEHLYWRHGTESVWCNICDSKRWIYADHICYVLPIYDTSTNLDNAFETSQSEYISNRESEYCHCGKLDPSPMIGCDGPRCTYQWYHYTCVGIEVPPPGDWFCPQCKTQKSDEDKRQPT